MASSNLLIVFFSSTSARRGLDFLDHVARHSVAREGVNDLFKLQFIEAQRRTAGYRVRPRIRSQCRKLFVALERRGNTLDAPLLEWFISRRCALSKLTTTPACGRACMPARARGTPSHHSPQVLDGTRLRTSYVPNALIDVF